MLLVKDKKLRENDGDHARAGSLASESAAHEWVCFQVSVLAQQQG
jgi:hypothetical protein